MKHPLLVPFIKTLLPLLLAGSLVACSDGDSDPVPETESPREWACLIGAIGLANMVAIPEYQTQYGFLMAGTLLSILPVAILFFILQRDFISGLTSGAIKG
jgi:hypothetical protein